MASTARANRAPAAVADCRSVAEATLLVSDLGGEPGCGGDPAGCDRAGRRSRAKAGSTCHPEGTATSRSGAPVAAGVIGTAPGAEEYAGGEIRNAGTGSRRRIGSATLTVDSWHCASVSG